MFDKSEQMASTAASERWEEARGGRRPPQPTALGGPGIPPEILKHYKNIHLDMDIMFINEVAFFLATSRFNRQRFDDCIEICT